MAIRAVSASRISPIMTISGSWRRMARKVAGRTASSFTAQIGSMRANEEIDAIRVLGLDPVELLVLPRVYALLIALPMLTFVAMVSGLVGGMLVSATTLDISPVLFLSRIQDNVGLIHFWVGMAKAPIFAFLIAVIGCLEGFRVQGSAQSVGEHTTSAVVQSIFVVIVVDAISGSSVDTITRSKQPLSRAAAMEWAMIGLPANGRMFLRGMRLLPPRAGMIATFIRAPWRGRRRPRPAGPA